MCIRDRCVSRAVANLASLSEYCMPFVKVGGDFVPYKSGEIEEELEAGKRAVKILGGEVEQVEKFTLPGADASLSLIHILSITLEGDDMGILIGKRGQTLDSLQYLVSLIVNKNSDGYLRVKLDTENYREKRKKTLETLAKNIAYKVKRTKRPVSLEPMNPYERRICLLYTSRCV